MSRECPVPAEDHVDRNNPPDECTCYDPEWDGQL